MYHIIIGHILRRQSVKYCLKIRLEYFTAIIPICIQLDDMYSNSVTITILTTEYLQMYMLYFPTRVFPSNTSRIVT